MDNSLEKVLNKMAAICSKKEYCKSDIREKLHTTTLASKEQEQIITWLIDNRFLDDERYALAYAKDKFRFNGWGKQKISMMLHQKGIDDIIIQRAIANIPHSEYNDRCYEILKAKLKNIKADNPATLKGKLIRFSLGRGFDYQTSLETIERLLSTTPLTNL